MMGIDARIAFRVKDADEQIENAWMIPQCWTVGPAISYLEEGATHEVGVDCRYWSPTYERGPWPMLACVLMALLADPNVAEVFYYNDHVGGLMEFTPQMLDEYNREYLRGAP